MAAGGSDKVLRRADEAVFRVRFDRHSTIPPSQQLVFHLLHAISTGRLKTGEVLPSIREAAQLIGLAPATVQKAYNDLKADGLLVSRAGHSVSVGDFEPRVTPATPTTERMLDDILVPAITQAASLGFEAADIVERVRHLASDWSPAAESRVVFVAMAHATTAKYTDLIAEHFAGSPVQVYGLGLDAYDESAGAALDELLPVRLLVSLVPTMRRLREIGGPRGIETFGLTVEYNEETKRSLLSLPFGTQAAVVVAAEYAASSISLIEQICGDSLQITSIPDDSRESRAAIAKCSVVLHTHSRSELAHSIAPPGVPMIELVLKPMRAALDHLSAILLPDIPKR